VVKFEILFDSSRCAEGVGYMNTGYLNALRRAQYNWGGPMHSKMKPNLDKVCQGFGGQDIGGKRLGSQDVPKITNFIR
jgi:hypothetical protein